MKTRELREDEVTFEIICEPEHIPLEGNVLASGDDEEDSSAEDWVRTELRSGNDWAWCTAIVRATWKGFVGESILGCCSYRSREDFMAPDGYYPQMRRDALDDLNSRVQATNRTLSQLRE